MDVPPSKKTTIFVVSADEDIRRSFRDGMTYFSSLAKAEEVTIQSDKSGIPENAVSAIIAGAEFLIPFDQLVDIEKEKERLGKEKARLEKEIARCEGMLNNEKFISKAPAAKVEEEREKLKGYRQMMDQVTERLAGLC